VSGEKSEHLDYLTFAKVRPTVGGARNLKRGLGQRVKRQGEIGAGPIVDIGRRQLRRMPGDGPMEQTANTLAKVGGTSGSEDEAR